MQEEKGFFPRKKTERERLFQHFIETRIAGNVSRTYMFSKNQVIRNFTAGDKFLNQLQVGKVAM